MAIYNPVSVCSMAIDRCDIGQPITDLEADSDDARACNRWYTKCRDKVLQLNVWPFAQRQVALGLVEEDPSDRWAFAYRYPVNCLRVLGIVNAMRVDTARIEWAMGQDDTGLLIFTDEEDAFVDYIGTLDDPGEWFDLFADTVAYLLASEIAGPLGRGDAVRERNFALFNVAKAAAFAKAQSEGFLRRATSSYITARGAQDTRLPYPR